MASGSSTEPQPALARTFYCHQCHTRTYPTTEHIDNFTCMRCGSGFVEDVTVREDSPSSNSDDQSWGEVEAGIGDAFENLLEDLQGGYDNDRGAADQRPRSSRRRARMIQLGGAGSNPMTDQFIQSLLTNLVGGGRGELPPGAINISGSRGYPGGGIFQVISGPAGGGGVPMMPLYGNPGDYAWGRSGLDAIVTQLLNQMDGTGPPPMNLDEIKKIPTIKVNQSHIDANLQCSVCWDDFKMEENVRQLKCEHIFHEDCIVPWLELHNTCPVCRKEQQDGPQQPQHPEGVSVSHSAPTSAASSISSTSSSSTSSSTTPATTSSAQALIGTTTAAEQLAASLGSTISLFNQFFGAPSRPEASATVTSTATTSTSSTQPAPGSNHDMPRTDQSTSTDSSSNQQFHDMDLE